MSDNGKSKLRFVKKTSPDNILHSDDSAPKTLGVLSAESLSPFVEEPKLIHIMKYLESLSGESNSPQNFEQHDNFDQVTPFEENCKTKCYAKSYVDSNLSRGSNSEKYSSEENMSKQLSPVRGSINFKNKKILTNVPKSRSKTTCTTEKELPQLPFELAQLPLLDNYTNSLEEKLSQDSQKLIKVKEKNKQMKFSVFNIFADEVNKLTHTLLASLQKHTCDLTATIASLRENITVTSSALVAKEAQFQPKNLKNLAKACKESRIHAEKSLKKVLTVGQKYFEAEESYEKRLRGLQKKVIKKYTTRIKTAMEMASKAMDEQVISKTNALLKSVVKKIERL
ncbi:SYCP2_SLD domain-containing protein [Caerostris darwini]|uniref:SYCP2_SLD domain-containing protein n=1 Tax=Caerostris darwini TaxID=1538125 RepID=A0AAV4U721_9ARAC|nr:SYCP2_SLD domain-containing protein [Caerostris darwini]